MKNLLILILAIYTFGCSKTNEPETPVKDETLYKSKLDFNNDGSVDLNIEVGNSGTQDIPQSSGTNTFIVSSADSNLSFLSKSVNLDDYLYEESKIVNFDSLSNFSYKYFYIFLYKRNIGKGNYISDWEINNDFLSKKIIIFKNSKKSKYGWIKLDFNISTKKLTIVDYYETNLKTITTGKK